MISRPYRPAYFLPAEMLPTSFRYPDSYKTFSEQRTPQVGPVNEDWCVLSEGEVDSMLAHARELSPHRQLVPFMRRNGEDGVACFDGATASNDPKVYVFNYSADVGCGPTHKTFSEWLAEIPASEDEEDNV